MWEFKTVNEQKFFNHGNDWYAINHIISIKPYQNNIVISFTDGTVLNIPDTTPKKFFKSIGLNIVDNKSKPYCRKCERGIGWWISQDESPCSCNEPEFEWS